MSEFADLVSRAVNPSMTRAERESVYDVVRQAVARLQEREASIAEDVRASLQRHLVEETIRDIESEIARHVALEKMEKAAAAQDAESAALRGR